MPSQKLQLHFKLDMSKVAECFDNQKSFKGSCPYRSKETLLSLLRGRLGAGNTITSDTLLCTYASLQLTVLNHVLYVVHAYSDLISHLIDWHQGNVITIALNIPLIYKVCYSSWGDCHAGCVGISPPLSPNQVVRPLLITTVQWEALVCYTLGTGCLVHTLITARSKELCACQEMST